MADKKISQLTNLTGASLAEDDEFVLVDTSADETKAITWSELKEGLDTGTGFVRITGDTMTGDLTVPNVVVSGNVDGRDVSADGTKLDGIEAGADVTDTANVTSAGALMDSEVTNLAQVKAFDSSDYATAAQGTLADSAVQPNDSPTFNAVIATSYSGDGSALTGLPAGYTDADVDTHLNTGTAANGEVLSWTGADYDWIATGGGGITYTRYTANVTIAANAGAIADTSGGSWTLTLPASPSSGDVVVVADGADWSTNNLTVGRNGSTIEGASEDLTMDIGNVSSTLIYDGSTWQVYVQAGASEPSAFTASSTDTLTNKTISGSSNTITVDGTNPVGYLNLPPVGTKTTSYSILTSDVGKYVQVGTSGSITVPDATFAEGDAVSLFNNTTGDVTITCSVTTAYIAGADADVASVTLATRGVANVLFISPTVCVITGNVS